VAGLFEPALVAALIVLGAWAGLHHLEPDSRIRARTGGLAGIAAVAMAGALAGLVLRPETGPLAWVPALFCAQMAVAAWIDRQTTWVPDTVLLGMCLVAVLAGFGQPASPVAALVSGWQLSAPPILFGLAWAVAGLAWAAAFATWRLQAMLGRARLTPPDLVAFMLPLGVFGPTGPAAATYALTGGLALGVMHVAPLRRALIHPQAAAEGARDLGLDGNLPVPALMLALPALAAVYLAAG